MLIQLLKQFNIDFCAVNEANITDIIFMLPYYPFANYPKNCARIDSFYIASNALYKKAKEIAQVLKDNGYEIVDRELQLKKVAEKGGLGSILNNQLLVNKKYGSRTTLQGISIVGEYEYYAYGTVDKICDNCHKCDFACPNKALNKGNFIREKCIRQTQYFPTDYNEIVAGRVLGCEECQNICPYNSLIQKVEMPQNVRDIFDYNNIFEMIKGGKKALVPLANLIGSIYARPGYIFKLVVNSLLSSGNFEYSEVIKEFENNSNKSICEKVAFYFEKINTLNKI